MKRITLGVTSASDQLFKCLITAFQVEPNNTVIARGSNPFGGQVVAIDEDARTVTIDTKYDEYEPETHTVFIHTSMYGYRAKIVLKSELAD